MRNKELRVRFERLKYTIEYILYIAFKPTHLNARLSFTILSVATVFKDVEPQKRFEAFEYRVTFYSLQIDDGN